MVIVSDDLVVLRSSFKFCVPLHRKHICLHWA